MSHRIKRFAAFAIFALFYLVAAVDLILGIYRHQTDTKKAPKPPLQLRDQVYQMNALFGVDVALSLEENLPLRADTDFPGTEDEALRCSNGSLLSTREPRFQPFP